MVGWCKTKIRSANAGRVRFIKKRSPAICRINHMTKRPVPESGLDSETFRAFYYLKEELVDFCRRNGLPASGGKIELTDRIAYFLDTGEAPPSSTAKKKAAVIHDIHVDTKIASDFVCSEKHRAFFKEQIGSSFSFHVAFQKWLKGHAGKTYHEAITAYDQILADQKKEERKLRSSLNTIPISVISLRIIRENLQKKLLCAGNTKNNYKDTIGTNHLTLWR